MTVFQCTTPSSKTIRFERVFDAPANLVWRAHTEPELVKKWMSGPEGNSLPVCEIDLRVGGKGRFVWKNADFEMEMISEYKEIILNRRIVYTESYEMWPEGASTVTANFVEENGKTILTIEIEYLSEESRDAAMNRPSYVDDFRTTYEALERHLTQMSK